MKARQLTVLIQFFFILLVCHEINGQYPSMGEEGGVVGEAPYGEEKWGYVDVREGAHMFWWLYHTTHPDGYLNRPLVIWFSGGPGSSSTGYGNFEIIGPMNLDEEYNEYTWMVTASLLFVDHPVGSGWSYVDGDQYYTTTGAEVTADLMAFTTVFLQSHPEFQTIPIYVVGQSYGGKMAASYAVGLNDAIENGDIIMDFRGFAMGNAWHSPIDSTMTWANLLWEMSLTDDAGRDEILASAESCREAVEAEQWQEATNRWRDTQFTVFRNTWWGLDFYNIINYGGNPSRATSEVYRDDLDASSNGQKSSNFINTVIREKLGIIPDDVVWDSQAGNVFAFLEGDFMKPVLQDIDYILNNTDIHVITYQGQVDLICDTSGAKLATSRLQWPEMPQYYSSNRRTLSSPDTGAVEMFVKAYNQFKFYWVLLAGHSVPTDSPAAALRMINRILDDVDN